MCLLPVSYLRSICCLFWPQVTGPPYQSPADAWRLQPAGVKAAHPWLPSQDECCLDPFIIYYTASVSSQHLEDGVFNKYCFCYEECINWFVLLCTFLCLSEWCQVVTSSMMFIICECFMVTGGWLWECGSWVIWYRKGVKETSVQP